MKTKLFLSVLFLVAGIGGISALAEDVARPSPAPAVSPSTDSGSVDEPAAIDHVVFLAKLPSPDELIKAAETKGTPIVRMDQTANRIVVVYQYAGGRTVTFAYALLSSAGSGTAPAAPTASSSNYQVVSPTPAPTVVTTAPTVVYAEPPEVYYAPRVRYYDPAWDFWSPFALGVGLGWVGGHSSHSYGGWHGGGGWHGSHGHGGWHR